MLSQTVDYALHAVVHLAHQAPAARTTDQMAMATLVDALALVEQAFRKTTLAEIVAERTQSRPLCEVQSGRRT